MPQTILTVMEIRSILRGKANGHPLRLLVDELGALATAGDVQARQELGELLSHDSEEVRGHAYVCLFKLGKEEYNVALAQFADRPENNSIVDWARQAHDILPPAAD